MKQALQLQFIGLEPSAAVEAAVREKAARLDRFRPDLIACRVVVELLDKHKHQGRHYAVRITVTVPGDELCVDRVKDEDVHVALREAFDDIRRQLQDAVRRLQDRTAAPLPAARGEPAEG